MGQPDRMLSPLYYCGTGDYGGVHYNSGVGNKAAYLMTDGGTFNGWAVSGIGITKTVSIFYNVQDNRLTSTADYFDLYAALTQACTSLIGGDGASLRRLHAGGECRLATEMNWPSWGIRDVQGNDLLVGDWAL